MKIKFLLIMLMAELRRATQLLANAQVARSFMGITTSVGRGGNFKSLLLLPLICCLCLLGCAAGKESPRGFSLPEGDAAAGKSTFVALQCNACHTTKDVEQLPTADAGGMSVRLGGEVARVKTYADLVTSIINPSHRLARGLSAAPVATDGESHMLSYNDVMTVEQLINLVSYLQPQYKLQVPVRTNYPGYLYP